MKIFLITLISTVLTLCLSGFEKKYSDLLLRISRGETNSEDQKIIEALNQATQKRIAELEKELAIAKEQKLVGEHWREGYPALGQKGKSILLSVYNYELYSKLDKGYQERIENDFIEPSENIKIILLEKPPKRSRRKGNVVDYNVWVKAEIIAQHIRMQANVFLTPETLRRCKKDKELPTKKYYVLSGGKGNPTLRLDLTDDIEVVKKMYRKPEFPYWGDRTFIHYMRQK